MSKKQEFYQSVIITLSDESTHVFTGRAFTNEGEKRKITDILFTEPKPMPDGCKFEMIGEMSV